MIDTNVYIETFPKISTIEKFVKIKCRMYKKIGTEFKNSQKILSQTMEVVLHLVEKNSHP